MSEPRPRDVNDRLIRLLDEADTLIETSLADSDRAVDDLLAAIEAFHAAGGAPGHRQPAERIVVAMQFYDLLCQRLRLVQQGLDECRRLTRDGASPAGHDGLARLADGMSRLRHHDGEGGMEFYL